MRKPRVIFAYCAFKFICRKREDMQYEERLDDESPRRSLCACISYYKEDTSVAVDGSISSLLFWVLKHLLLLLLLSRMCNGFALYVAIFSW